MKRTNSITGLHQTLAYLLELIGFGFILIPVRVLPISHPQPPHSQDAVDVVPHPSILMVLTSWKQPRNWILTTAEGIKNKYYYLKFHLSISKGNKMQGRAKGDFTTDCTLQLLTVLQQKWGPIFLSQTHRSEMQNFSEHLDISWASSWAPSST